VGCEASRSVDELSHRLAKRHPEWNLVAAPAVVSDDISCETLPPYSSIGSTLLRCDAGKLTFRPGFTAAEITLDRPDHARGVRCVESHTGKWYEVSGRVILSCASTIESIRLLLASAGQDYRNGLGNSSGTLGRYLLDHFGGPRMVAVGSITEVRAHSTERLYVPRFCNRGQQSEKFLRGYGIQGELEVRPSGYAVLSVGVYGEVLPEVGNHVKLQAETKDAAGLRVLNIRYLYGSNERSMAEHAALALRELASAIDFRPLIVHEGILPGGTRAHELGGARMGASPANSVLNPFNQSWDVPNLFITDGSCFPSSGYRAPTLTIMALTARAAEHILSLLHANL
jgi:choline dehydrogenase-like flavoprotein